MFINCKSITCLLLVKIPHFLSTESKKVFDLEIFYSFVKRDCVRIFFTKFSLCFDFYTNLAKNRFDQETNLYLVI